MRLAYYLLLFALIAQTAAASEPPKVVEVPRDNPTGWTEFTASVGKPLILDAKSPAKWGLWDDDTADLVPVEGGSKAVFSAPKAGRYKLAVAVGEDLVRIAVTVGTNPKPPVPVPPKPPEPAPPVPPPAPVDPLTTELATLYAAEPATTRKADMQSLSALYTLMVTESADATYGTASELNAKFVTARDSMLTDSKTKLTRLPGVRKRCGGEVSAVIGDNPDAPLTDASRKAVAGVYERLAKCVNDAAK